MNLKSKLFTGAVAFAIILGAVAIPASAQTTAELQAQIASLLAQITQLQAQLGGATVTSATFTTDLTVGSKGADVTALQTWLVGKGFLTMPAGVAMGYFGSLTKVALAKYQVSVGITPAAGYFGPITRAKVNGSTTTTTTTTTVPPGAITTPGAEGTVSATESSAGTVSTVYVGDTQAPVLGIKVTATGSDMPVQRMKFKLSESTGNYNTQFYTKVYSKLYVTEGGNVLASTDLNSSTVTKDGTSYYVTVSGFNSVVPKGSSKIYLIKLDAFSSIDSTVLARTFTVTVPTDGIRAVDGAGIDDYTGDTSIAASPDIAASLTESATLTLSLNASSPKKNDVICSGGTNSDECDKLTLLVFDMKAQKDSVKVTDLNIQVDKTGGGGANASTTVYLYDGSTEVANATVDSVSGDTAIFSDLDYTIGKDVTKTFTVKADIRSANTTRASFIAYASSSGVTDENAAGEAVTDSGTATGNSIGILKVGPEFTLVSKSITTDGVPQGANSNANSTSTLAATFNIKIKAVGGALEFGTSQATTSPFVSSTTGFAIYVNGSANTTNSSAATSTSIAFPSTCVVGSMTNGCSLADGSEITVPVTFSIQGRSNQTGVINSGSGLYSVGIARLNWTYVPNGVASNSTFMSGETDWRTSDVTFP